MAQTCTLLKHPLPGFCRFLPLTAPGGTALDLAAGTGRHSRLLLAHGLAVTALDRDPDQQPDAPGPDQDPRRSRGRQPLALARPPLRSGAGDQLPAPARSCPTSSAPSRRAGCCSTRPSPRAMSASASRAIPISCCAPASSPPPSRAISRYWPSRIWSWGRRGRRSSSISPPSAVPPRRLSRRLYLLLQGICRISLPADSKLTVYTQNAYSSRRHAWQKTKPRRLGGAAVLCSQRCIAVSAAAG